MNETLQPALTDVLAYLMSISAEGVRPREAQRRLGAVQARHPAVDLELLWEEESYDQSLHYDVLLRPVGGATVSISVAPEPALPWPLRGVRRFSEANLLQVNGRTLTMEEAVGFLDVLWDEAPIMDRMVNACLIREELARHPIDLSDAELQAGMDSLRRARKLYTAADASRWMQQRGMSHAQLEQLVVGTLTTVKLRQRIAEGRVASYFEAHRAALDIAQVTRVECPDAETARCIHREVGAGEVALLDAAQRQFLAAAVPGRITFTTLRRRDASDPLGAAIFAANPGDVVGPRQVGETHVIAGVLALTPSRPDEPTRAIIEQLLFDEWLAERRRTASITWQWGTAGRAPDPE